MESDITQALALAVGFLSEAVVLTEVERDRETVVFINQAFERLTGYSLEPLRETGLKLLQGPETDSAAVEWLVAPPYLGEHGFRDILLYGKSKIPFWDRVTINRFEVLDKVFRLQAHADVTREKAFEEQLVAVQRHEARSYLISALAHDFNNLLTAIQVYSGLLAAKVKGQAQLERYIHEIQASAERAGQLVGQFQSLGRQDSAELELVDLQDVVTQSVELLKRLLGDDIQLSMDADSDLGKVKAHPARIQQILLNLAVTAREVMPNGGEMPVRLRNEGAGNSAGAQPLRAGNFVLLLVRSTGIGIDTESFANVVESSVNVRTQSSAAELRLFVVRAIVEQYGGSMNVETEAGRSVSFKMMLPTV